MEVRDVAQAGNLYLDHTAGGRKEERKEDIVGLVRLG
jgi:hypothetical protein